MGSRSCGALECIFLLEVASFDGTRGSKNLEHSHVSSSEQFRDNLVRDKCIVENEDD